jgi:aminoacrylate peracid reductase
MPRTPVVPAGSPPPMAPYSPGAKHGNMLFISGMLAVDKEGKPVGVNDITVQTRAVIEMIKTVIEAAGGSLDDVIHNAIFLKDLAHYGAMNAVYAEYFGKRPPARYCIRADLVRPEFLVEISSIACLS